MIVHYVIGLGSSRKIQLTVYRDTPIPRIGDRVLLPKKKTPYFVRSVTWNETALTHPDVIVDIEIGDKP